MYIHIEMEKIRLDEKQPKNGRSKAKKRKSKNRSQEKKKEKSEEETTKNLLEKNILSLSGKNTSRII